IELQATDDMKVRTLQLPLDFDEKGRPKKYTNKEIQELRGPDQRLPGYTADFDSLKPEQTVKVYLAKKKAVAAPAPAAPPKGKDKDKDKDDDKPGAERPEIAMVVILTEPRK